VIVLQLCGTNAAGKSALLRTIVGWDRAAAVKAHPVEAEPVAFTTCPALRLVAVGDYLDRSHNTPGADRISPKTRLLGALDQAIALATPYARPIVAWEGIILQTKQYLLEYWKRGLTPLFVYLGIPEAVAFARIEARSGKARIALSGQGRIVTGRINTARNIVHWARIEQQQPTLLLDGTEPLERLAEKVMAELVKLR